MPSPDVFYLQTCQKRNIFCLRSGTGGFPWVHLAFAGLDATVGLKLSAFPVSSSFLPTLFCWLCFYTWHACIWLSDDKMSFQIHLLHPEKIYQQKCLAVPQCVEILWVPHWYIGIQCQLCLLDTGDHSVGYRVCTLDTNNIGPSLFLWFLGCHWL